jgi:hypothetical protein
MLELWNIRSRDRRPLGRNRAKARQPLNDIETIKKGLAPELSLR